MALRDRLHQPYRESLIPEYGKVKAAAEQCGAIAFCISGAGPTPVSYTHLDVYKRQMEWERTTGTRTQVQLTFISGKCRIFRPSFWSFISSEV